MTSRHIIQSYDGELAHLMDGIQHMGAMVKRQLRHLIDALERRDADAARHIIDADDAIDDLEHVIGEDVVRLLALRAPMAGDLRRVFAALRIAGDLERIGDCTVGMARRIDRLPAHVPDTCMAALTHLHALASTAVADVLCAWRDANTGQAWKVWHADQPLDMAYTHYFSRLLSLMMQDPRQINACTQFLFMAKNIERIGDHATNIAENVWFTVTGERLTADSPPPPDSRHRSSPET